MAQRKVPLVNGEIYHIYNRSIARQPIFTYAQDLSRLLRVIDYYRFEAPSLRFSHFNRLPLDRRPDILKFLYQTESKIVDLYAFSLMPNHFHFLAKQTKDNGIKKFTSQIQNSYAKYYNTKNKRIGSLFQEMFKAVRIETDEQFIHLCRYIHLNPLSSSIIKNPDALMNYPWTSFMDYVENRNLPFINKKVLTGFFPKITSLKKFTFDQADHQRALEQIKHLLVE